MIFPLVNRVSDIENICLSTFAAGPAIMRGLISQGSLKDYLENKTKAILNPNSG